jgi:hypothetical protein
MKGRRWWRGSGFLLTLMSVLGLSALTVWGGYAWGVANDCTPDQIDGQCGMAIALGELIGRIGGGIIAILGTVAAVRYWRAKCSQ